MKFMGFGHSTVDEVEQEVAEISTELNKEQGLHYLKEKDRGKYSDWVVRFTNLRDDMIDAWKHTNATGRERIKRAYVRLTGFVARTKDKLLIEEMKNIGEKELKLRYV